MADFIAFDEGENLVATSGLPGTCHFDLSTKSVGATSPFVESDTYSSRGVLTGTGYAEINEARPSPSAGTLVFAQKLWNSGTATNWSSTARSIVMSNGGTAICAWNLQAGGAARDLSAANTAQGYTPTLIVGS